MSEKTGHYPEQPSSAVLRGAGGLALKLFNRSEYYSRVAASRMREFIDTHTPEIAAELAGQIEAVSRVHHLLGVKQKPPKEYDRNSFEDAFERRHVKAKLADGRSIKVGWEYTRTTPREQTDPVLTVAESDKVMTEVEELWEQDTQESRTRRAQLRGEARHTAVYRLPKGNTSGPISLQTQPTLANALPGAVSLYNRGGRSHRSGTHQAAATEPLALLTDNWEELCAAAGVEAVYEGPTSQDLLATSPSLNDLANIRKNTFVPEGAEDNQILF